MDGVALTVRRIEAGEWKTLRRVRLTALSTDPSAFGSTYEREAASGEAEWRRRASHAAEGAGSCYLLAEQGDEVVGIIGAWWPPEDDDPQMVSMWVRPEARGTGAAAALVEALIGWTHQVEAKAMWLYVTLGNDPAEKLYRRFGFDDWPDDAGESVHPCSGERRMRLDLA